MRLYRFVKTDDKIDVVVATDLSFPAEGGT